MVSSPDWTTTELLAGADDLALDALALGRAERHGAADRVAKVLGLAQRPLDARRRDVDGVFPQVLAQHVGDARAEPVVDTVRVIDEDGEASRARPARRRAPRRRAGPSRPPVRSAAAASAPSRVLRSNVVPSTKMGAARPFRPAVKMVKGIVASEDPCGAQAVAQRDHAGDDERGTGEPPRVTRSPSSGAASATAKRTLVSRTAATGAAGASRRAASTST